MTWLQIFSIQSSKSNPQSHDLEASRVQVAKLVVRLRAVNNALDPLIQELSMNALESVDLAVLFYIRYSPGVTVVLCNLCVCGVLFHVSRTMRNPLPNKWSLT
mgnify:FL=1